MCYFGWAFSNKKYDKALHFSISAAMTFVLLTLSHYAEINWWWAPISVLIIGLFKEAYDRIWGKKHLFDFNDLVADAVGIGGITLPFIFSFLLSK